MEIIVGIAFIITTLLMLVYTFLWLLYFGWRRESGVRRACKGQGGLQPGESGKP